jgi:hypothetical protein
VGLIGRLRELLVYFGLFLSIFQNTFLIEFLGYLGASISFFLILMLIFLSIFYKDGFLKISIWHMYLYVIISIVTFYGFYQNYGVMVFGRGAIEKGVNLLILNVLLFAPMYIKVSLSRVLLIRTLSASIITLWLGFFVYDVLRLEAFSGVFLFLESHDGRPRGFSVESSYFGITSCCLSIALLSLRPRRESIIGYSGFLLVLLSTSKGSLLCLFLGLTYAIYLLNKRVVLTRLLIVAPLLMLVLVFLIDGISFDGGVTFTTRATVLYMAMIIFIDNIFGVSYSGYLSSFSAYLPKAIDGMASLPVIGDEVFMGEVMGYVAADDDAGIGTKSLFFDNLMSYGLAFIGVFYLVVKRAVRDNGNNLYAITLIFVMVLSLMTFIHGYGFYYYSLLFLLLNNYKNLRA